MPDVKEELTDAVNKHDSDPQSCTGQQILSTREVKAEIVFFEPFTLHKSCIINHHTLMLNCFSVLLMVIYSLHLQTHKSSSHMQQIKLQLSKEDLICDFYKITYSEQFAKGVGLKMAIPEEIFVNNIWQIELVQI